MARNHVSSEYRGHGSQSYFMDHARISSNSSCLVRHQNIRTVENVVEFNGAFQYLK